jgi:hypothetical protein
MAQLGPVPSTDEKSPVRQNTAIQQLFSAVADLRNGSPNFNGLTNAANDGAAAAAGVAVGQLYRNGSVMQIRVS